MNVTVVDYGIGNILSVTRSLEYWGAKVELSNDYKKISSAERLVLPGVGAFGKGMEALVRDGIDQAILEYSLEERPFLGICLGMQMMLSESEEFGTHRGLNLIPGKVTKIPNTNAAGEFAKIPHIGWNSLQKNNETDWDNNLLNEIEPGCPVYFVHSYQAQCENNKNILAHCFYNDMPIAGVIQKEHLYGCQFHPEKSGPAGLKIIKNFLELS